MTENRSALVLCGFRSQPEKVDTHIQPLSMACGRTVVIWPNEGQSHDEIVFISAKYTDYHVLNLLVMLTLALRLGLREQFSVIVTFSLLPYGTIGLTVGQLARTPVHLGIIGGDLDVHAQGKFGLVVLWLFGQFHILTVATKRSKEQLVTMGIRPEKIYTVPHPPSERYFQDSSFEDSAYDLLWVGRLTEEKNPEQFIRILNQVTQERSEAVSAAILGAGPLEQRVREVVNRHNLSQQVDIVGRVEDPLPYYKQSAIYVLTSEREMLPVSLLEAMLLGTPSIAPQIGGIPDVIEHGENGILVSSQTISSYTEHVNELLSNPEYYRQISTAAPEISPQISTQSASIKWQTILQHLEEASG